MLTNPDIINKKVFSAGNYQHYIINIRYFSI